MLFKLAWRNLWRRKRRTLITTFTVAFGVWMSVTFIALAEYSYTSMINTGATIGFGHLTIEPKGYNESPTLDKRLHNASEIRRDVLSVSDIRNAAVRITGQAMFSSAAKSVGGTFIAVDPPQESPDINIFIKSIIKGSVFKESGGKGAVVGSKLAEKLNLNIGKKLIFTATDIHGEIVSEAFRVSGIFKTGSTEIDGYIVVLPIDRIRDTLHYGAGDATIVSIFINDYRYADSIRDIISSKIENSEGEVLLWNETQPDMAGIITLDRSMNYLFQFLMGILIASGILNTILMSVMERTKEFGIMMAIGMSPMRLLMLVLTESFLIGLVGVFAGIIITTPWFIYMSNVGIDLSRFIEEGFTAGGSLIDPVMKFRLYEENGFTIFLAVLFLTIIAGLYPAFRACRITPVESLKAI